MTIPVESEATSAQSSIWNVPPMEDENSVHLDNAGLSDEFERCDDVWALLVRDGLDYPISHLPVRVEIPGMNAIETTTNEEGVIVLPAPKSFEGEATVSVQGMDGKFQESCKLDLAHCGTGAVIHSPKVAAPMKTKIPSHAMSQVATASAATPSDKSTSSASAVATPQTDCEKPSSTGMWYEVNQALEKSWGWLAGRVHESDKKQPSCGTSVKQTEKPNISSQHVVKESASGAGNPITVVVGPECPSKDNLRLGRNNIYRAAIIKAANRCGLMPQAMAALIDAEAAKKTESIPVIGPYGKPIVNKKTGKPKVKSIAEQWNKDSYNVKSRAAGLTQFLESTWLWHVMISGRYIHEQSVAKGWVKKEKDAKGKSTVVFVLADGKKSPRPWDHIGDANVQACLKERYNAEWSIMAAADYGKANFDLLQAKGFKLKGLNDAEKAKLIYLMHHEGEGNGPLFIRNELQLMPKKKFPSPETRLRNIFEQQVGKKEADKMIEKSFGEVNKSYRSWLSAYIDHKIILGRFCCDLSKMPTSSDVPDIFIKIGGS